MSEGIITIDIKTIEETTWEMKEDGILVEMERRFIIAGKSYIQLFIVVISIYH